MKRVAETADQRACVANRAIQVANLYGRFNQIRPDVEACTQGAGQLTKLRRLFAHSAGFAMVMKRCCHAYTGRVSSREGSRVVSRLQNSDCLCNDTLCFLGPAKHK